MENKNQEDFDFNNLPSRSERYKKQNRKSHSLRKKVCSILLILLLLVFYGIGAFAMNLLNSAKTTLSKAYMPSSTTSGGSKILKQKKPFSILLLGTDTGDLGRTDKGRTDTMIVMTVNPKTEKITMTSIPRDACVTISGSDNQYDKINSAYTYGGIKLAVKTVKKTLNIPINFYMLVNMGGLTKVVDDLGGVTVTPPLTFSYDGVSVTKGKKVTLNGTQALSYARMRDDDPEGDYGRQKRQKQIISAIIKKAMSVSSLTKYNKTLKSIQDNLKTNLSYDDLMLIETYYKNTGKNIKSYVLQGEDATLGGLSYQVIPASEKEKASNRIRKQLGLKDSTYDFEKDSPFYSSSSNGTGTSYGTTDSYGYGYGNDTTSNYGNSYGNTYGSNQGTGTTGQGTGAGTGTETTGQGQYTTGTQGGYGY